MSSCKIQCKREIKQTKANICFVQIKTHSKNNRDYYLCDITEKDFPIFLYFYVVYIFKQQYNLSWKCLCISSRLSMFLFSFANMHCFVKHLADILTKPNLTCVCTVLSTLTWSIFGKILWQTEAKPFVKQWKFTGTA